MKRAFMALFVALTLGFGPVACSGKLLGGAALGVAGAGAAYEYNNKRQMDQLNEDYKSGKINQQEYDSRKNQIEKGSIIY